MNASALFDEAPLNARKTFTTIAGKSRFQDLNRMPICVSSTATTASQKYSGPIISGRNLTGDNALIAHQEYEAQQRRKIMAQAEEKDRQLANEQQHKQKDAHEDVLAEETRFYNEALIQERLVPREAAYAMHKK